MSRQKNISVPSAQEHTLNFTPSLAALDDAQVLMRREWGRGEPGEDIPRQYSTLYEHLTPTQPRHEDMRMDSTLNVTPEESLSDLLAATGGNTNLKELQQVLEAPEIDIVGTQPSAIRLDQADETPYTSVKIISERTSDRQRAGQIDITRRVQRMREVSQEDALTSARHFFAPENGQNQVVSLGPSGEVPIPTTIGATLETYTLADTTPVLLLPLPLQPLELRPEVLDLSFLMGHLLDPPRQLHVDHKHGCRGFGRMDTCPSSGWY